MKKALLSLIIVVLTAHNAFSDELYQKLQEISVTVKAGMSEGSGVIITREVRV